MKHFALVACLILSLTPTLQAVDPLRPEYKTWWAKQITDDIYTAGRLTETQYKYAGEVGFKTVISMFNQSSDATIGDEVLPSGRKAQDIVERLVGIPFHIVLGESSVWRNISTVQRLTELMETATRPVLFHCNSAYSATFTTLSYLANISRHDPDAVPTMDSMAVYERAASLGYFYNGTAEKEIISTITGEPVVTFPPDPGFSIPNWNAVFWLVKPLYKNWYIGGQVRKGYWNNIAVDYDAIINTRLGLTTPPDNDPSQEEVTLLNIHDDTGTYNGTGRQSEERLLQTRLDDSKPNEYVSDTSDKNYEAINAREYGDEIGYNEVMEKQDIEATGLEYIHTPVGGEYGLTVEMFEHYKDTWMEAGKQNAVMLHCRSGRRASIAGLLAAGHQYGKNSTWALQRANDLGYHFEEDGAADVVKLLRDVLDRQPALTDDLQGGSFNSSGDMARLNLNYLPIIAILALLSVY